MFSFSETRVVARKEGVYIDGWSLKRAIWPTHETKGTGQDNFEHVNVIDDWTPAEERSLVRKLDFRVLFPVCLAYFVSYLCRANMGYADTLQSKTKYGVNHVLKLHGSDWNWAVSITYFAVLGAVLPSNLAMKRITGKYYFALVILGIGIVIACIAAVQNLAGLLAARFFLGIPEAAIPSSCLLYLSFWYKPSERTLRVGIFESSNALATAIGGFIAIGVDKLNGKGGLESWRWLFLIEGLICIVVSAPLFFLLLTYPETSKALTDRERHIAVNRLGRGATRSTDKTYDTSALTSLVSRPSTWVFFVAYLLQQIVSTSLNNFLPIILNNFAKFSSNKATVYTSLIYFAIIPCYCFWSWHSDHTQERTLHTLIPFLAAIPCFAIWTHVSVNKSFGSISPISLYGLAFLGHTVSMANPCVLSHRSSTLYGASEQTLGTAITLEALAIASIISPQIYSSSTKPWYLPGFITSACSLAVAFIGYASLPYLLAREAAYRKRRTGHAMPSRALEDALLAQVADETLANEIQRTQDEVAKELESVEHAEHAVTKTI